MVDFIGRFEHLEEDFKKVGERLRIGSKFPHLLPSKRGLYQDYYDGQLRKIIEKRYREDLDYFEYTFSDS